MIFTCFFIGIIKCLRVQVGIYLLWNTYGNWRWLVVWKVRENGSINTGPFARVARVFFFFSDSFRERIFSGCGGRGRWLHLGRSHATPGFAIQSCTRDSARATGQESRESGTASRDRSSANISSGSSVPEFTRCCGGQRCSCCCRC